MVKKFPGATPDESMIVPDDPGSNAQAAYMHAAQANQQGDQSPIWSRWFDLVRSANDGEMPNFGTGGKGSPSLAGLQTVDPSSLGRPQTDAQRNTFLQGIGGAPMPGPAPSQPPSAPVPKSAVPKPPPLDANGNPYSDVTIISPKTKTGYW